MHCLFGKEILFFQSRYTATANEVYLRWQLQYILNGQCSTTAIGDVLKNLDLSFAYTGVLRFGRFSSFTGVILSSPISHIARDTPSSTYKKHIRKKNENQRDIIFRTSQ